MEQKFIDRIEELRHHTYSRITKIQKNICPMVRKMYMNYQFEYWYDGYKYNLWEDDTHIYAVSDIPYCYDNELKNTVFKETLDKLVEEDKVWPFLLFVNNVVIPWSKITIIHDYDYSYLRIDDILPNHSFNATVVVFPLPSKMIRYGEDKDVLVTADRKGMYFGTDGKLLENPDFADISVRFEILDSNMYFKKVDITKVEGNYLEFSDLPDGYIPTLDNILTFAKDGSYVVDDVSETIADNFKGAYGLFDILKKDGNVATCILMYNQNNSTKQKAHIFSRADDLDKDTMLSLIKNADKNSEIWTDIVAPLIETFDFDHEFGTAYDTNLNNAVKYVTRYDFNLFKDLFTEDTNIKSFSFTGLDFKTRADGKGYVSFSRKHCSDDIEDVVIVFVNHKLYKYMIDVTYVNNTIRIPIFGILNDDHVEILMFTKCNNYIYTIKVNSADEEVYIHNALGLEDCYIMSETCPDAIYSVADNYEGRKQYVVDFTYTRSGDNYKITFDNDYYYGKELALVPKRQFRYYRFKQKDSQYKVILPTQFNYCHDPDRYLIFVNGKKIDRTEYTITIMNEDRPFDKLILYISTILDEGDYIDIFYIPEILIEKYKQDQMPKSGLLMLEDKTNDVNYPTTYPFSKDTALVFINGLKVNPLDIKDVSLNAMLINVDKYLRNEDGSILLDGYGNKEENPHQVDSIDNITILEYAVGDKEIAGYLEGLYEQIPEGEAYDPSKINFNHTASDAWKKLITTLLDKYAETGCDYAGLKKIFGNIFENENPAANYKDSFADLKSILYDAVLDYYLERSDVSTGEEFVYDFERSSFEPDVELDTTDVTKIIRMYPDQDKLLDYELTDQVAETDDVKEGKTFISADE